MFSWFPSSLSLTPGAQSGRLFRHIWSDRTLPGTWPLSGCVQHYRGRGGDPAGETLKDRGKKGKRKGREGECWVCWSLNVWYLHIWGILCPTHLKFRALYIAITALASGEMLFNWLLWTLIFDLVRAVARNVGTLRSENQEAPSLWIILKRPLFFVWFSLCYVYIKEYAY